MIQIHNVDGSMVLTFIPDEAQVDGKVFTNEAFEQHMLSLGAVGPYSDCIRLPERITTLSELVFDLDKAKEVAKNQLRVQRDKELIALDVQMMKRQEENLLGIATHDTKELAAKKKKLRDFPVHAIWSTEMTLDQIKSLDLNYFLEG